MTRERSESVYIRGVPYSPQMLTASPAPKYHLRPAIRAITVVTHTVNRAEKMTGRNAIISIRVTDAEKAQIETRAKAKGMTITAHTREIVTGFDADTVAEKARAAVEDQDAALSSLATSVETLTRDVQAISKRVRDDRIIWVSVTAVVVFLLAVLGGGLGYWFASIIGQ